MSYYEVRCSCGALNVFKFVDSIKSYLCIGCKAELPKEKKHA